MDIRTNKLGIGVLFLSIAAGWPVGGSASVRVLTKDTGSEMREPFPHGGGAINPVWEAGALLGVDWIQRQRAARELFGAHQS
jgi:hypothetical protein